MPLSEPSPRIRVAVALGAVAMLVAALVAPAQAAAADGLQMTARAMLQGHVRQGNWFAVAVDVSNAGPTIDGEIRITGGVDSRTRFGVPVELATGSRKQIVLYAQPPTFGGTMKVQLVDGDTMVAESKVAIALHDPSQLVVGVVAENPARIVGEIRLLPGSNGAQSVVVPLTPADLPDRVQAWSGIDRLVWQDTDAASLSPAQLAALKGWIAAGGRLVIVGGTAGADSLNAIPDELLPYRPSTVLDIDPSSISPLLGGTPAGATTLTALAGDAGAGTPLALSGDRVIAAERKVGNGAITLIGFDPTTSWIAQGEAWDTPLWRRLLPARIAGTTTLADDSQIVSAVSNLPGLALPPVGGLLVLLLGYIVLVGPVNYLVLKRLDRREWAWVTVPALILVFTVGAFGIGSLMRGTEVIVHEVAVVRGAPGTGSAAAQSYLGIFSPTRATFQLRVPGDALLSAPINGDIFGSGQVNTLDILQGDPTRVRDLSVGVGSLRTVRADASATGPQVSATLYLEEGRLKGTLTNESDEPLSSAAIVVGAAAEKLGDIAPGETVDISLAVGVNPMNQVGLSDRILKQVNWNGMTMSEEDQRNMVRRALVDQLSVDPMTGFASGFAADSATLISWGADGVVPLEVDGQRVRHLANVMYQVPIAYTARGTTTFRNDLVRSTVLDVNANFFSKDPWALNLGPGTAVVSYRPLGFEGSLQPASVRVAMTWGGDFSMPGGKAATLDEAIRCEAGTEGCIVPADGMPDVDILDQRTGTWVSFAHMTQGKAYELADAARWIDPATGEVRVRFVNQRADAVNFQLPIEITGTIR